MRISDMLLAIIHKSGGKMDSGDILSYIKKLEYYGMVEIADDLVSFRLTDKARSRLRDIGLF